VDTAKEHELKYILVEQNVNSKLTDVIQKEAKLTSLPIHNLSILTQDDIEKERDYFSIAKDNLDSLQKALKN
jgi:zinc transport system substrate-binding protein